MRQTIVKPLVRRGASRLRPGHLNQNSLRCVLTGVPARLIRPLRGLHRPLRGLGHCPGASLARPWINAIALACLVGATSCKTTTEPAEGTAVRATFDRYQAAIAAHDGPAAAALVTPKTVAYFGELLALTQHADRATLNERRLTDRLVALGARALFTVDELTGFEPRTFLAATLARGIAGMDGKPVMSLGPVTVNGGDAHGPLVLDGEATPVRLSFVRDAGAWRFDLVSLYDQVEDNVDGLPKQLDKPVDEWLLDAVASTVGHAVDASLWAPPLPAENPPPSP